MVPYKIVQTGPKMRLGGVYDGRGMSLYQEFVALETKGVPVTPPRMEAVIHVAVVAAGDITFSFVVVF